MADYWKIEKEQEDFAKRVEALEERVDELQREIADIKSTIARFDNKRSTEQNDEKRKLMNEYLDSIDPDSADCVIGKSTDELVGGFFLYCRLNGIDVEQTRGTQTVFTRVICKRYGCATRAGKFVELQETAK